MNQMKIVVIIMMENGKNTVTIQIGKGCRYYGLDEEAMRKLFSDLTYKNKAYDDAIRFGSYVSSDIPEKIRYFAVSRDGKIIWSPRGYIWVMKKWLKNNGYPVKIDDRTLTLPGINLKFQGKLRDYQEIAVNDIIRRYPIGVLKANTGSGKTIIAIAVIAKRKQPTLIIIHTKELLYQWQESIKKFLDYDCGIIGDGKFNIKDVSVGIINTVKNKMPELERKFGHIICDECFIAGTLIGDKPIETIKIGDYVNSFNHETNLIELKKVLNVFKHKPDTLCTVKLKNGKKNVCTTNHTFFDGNEYLTASELNDNSVLATEYTILKGEQNEKDHDRLSKLQKNYRVQNTLSEKKSKSKQKCILHTGVWNESYNPIFKIKTGQESQQQTDDRNEPNALIIKHRKNEIQEENKWNIQCMAWSKRWERNWTDSPTRKNGNCTWMGNGNTCKNSRSCQWKQTCVVSEKESTTSIQSGFRKSKIEDCNRNRWKESQFNSKKEIRQKERISLKMERVESVTVHKRRSGSEFGKVCPDGYVYNIEVEDNNNYFANGILVHNCHRVTSDTWSDTLIQFPAKHYMGLSATPYRKDGLGGAIYVHMGPKLHTVDKKLLFEKGQVLKPQIILVKTNFRAARSFIDEDQMPYATIIKKLTEDPKRNELIVRTIHADIKNNNGNILVVSDRVNHLNTLSKLLNSIKINHLVVSGKTASKKRKQIIKDMKNNKCRVLLSTLSLIGEGFSLDSLSCLCLTTPVKWKGRVIQSIGRILRPDKNKTPRVIDFRDENVRILKYSGYSRNKIYKDEWG